MQTINYNLINYNSIFYILSDIMTFDLIKELDIYKLKFNIEYVFSINLNCLYIFHKENIHSINSKYIFKDKLNKSDQLCIDLPLLNILYFYERKIKNSIEELIDFFEEIVNNVNIGTFKTIQIENITSTLFIPYKLIITYNNNNNNNLTNHPFHFNCNLINQINKINTNNINNTNNTIIISFLTWNYIDFFNIWYNHISKYNLDNILIICLDLKSYVFLKQYGINGKINRILYDLNNNDFTKKEEIRDFWVERVNIFRKVIHSNYNLIHTDLDAFWIKNIYNWIETTCNDEVNCSDMFFSRSTGMPKEVIDKLGAVLCCGLFYIKTNSKTKIFMNQYKKYTKQYKDDQIGINNLVYGTFLKLDKIDDYYDNIIIKLKNMQNIIKIGLLTDLIVSRQKSNNNMEMYVYHPYLGSNTDMKKKISNLLSNDFIQKKVN